ncbi:MAG TPA: 16S rRNA (guanine(527)-N(7))-methyltransferase RsmG [Puia sp.]|jgi:16S rRNA (guanine527-N7)-methyltransferase|nr:16S rRNA (guanine(527)-N(7))-methyltransferase RsmG [Puia sp.]
MEKAPGQLEIVLKYFNDFTGEEISRLAALGDLYKDWNAKINVISRKDIDGLYEKHILHSLAIAAAFDFQPDMEVIDIGTGGGFPGIPLAIFFPRTKFHLVDSIGKKIKVTDAIASAIGLTNVTTAHLRAEEIKGRKFDAAVSRAVAPLKDLWTWSRPLLRKSGSTLTPSNQSTTPSSQSIATIPSGLICLKGGDLAAEISASGLRPRILEIYQIFPLDYFHEKYLLQVPY